MAERVRRINPEVKWCQRPADRTEQCSDCPSGAGLSGGCDRLIDAKLDLIEACLKSGTGCLANGRGNRLDPTMFRIADISKPACVLWQGGDAAIAQTRIERPYRRLPEEPPVVRRMAR